MSQYALEDIKAKIYEGTEPYLYIFFCKEDYEEVCQILCLLMDKGHRIWFNTSGITLNKLTDKLNHADKILLFLSHNSVESVSLKQDLNYGLDHGIEIIYVKLEDIKIDKGLQVQLGLAEGFIATDNELAETLCKALGDRTIRHMAFYERLKKKRKLIRSIVSVIVLLIMGLTMIPVLSKQFADPVVLVMVGMNEDAAVKALEKSGYKVMKEYIYDEKIPSGDVVLQNKTGKLAKGRTVNITVSKGAENIILDDAITSYCLEQGFDTNGDGSFSPSELSNITTLEMAEQEIKDISGLKYMVKLTSLDLCNNKISEVSSLAWLDELNELYLDGNEINDLTPLATLDKLNILSICDNSISDITAIAYLSSLKELYISSNYITDITPLYDCNALKIEIYHNLPAISDWQEALPVVYTIKEEGRTILY